jgi:hypothetical protein
MLYMEIIAICSQIHTKHINTLCGQNIDLVNVELVEYTVTTGLYSIVYLCLTNHPVYPVQDLGSSVVMELAM